MKKILLSFICLFSVGFADCLPYADLISGKYKYSEKYGFYNDPRESTPKIKQMISIYYKEEIVREPSIHKVKKEYFRFLISERLYNALSNCSDYKDYIVTPDSRYYIDREIDSYDYGLLIDIKYASKIFKNLKAIEYGYMYNPYLKHDQMFLWINQEPEKAGPKPYTTRADFWDYLFVKEQ